MAALRLVSGRQGRSGRWLVLALAAFAVPATALFIAATLADREATLDQGWTDAANTASLIAEQADRALRIAEITTLRVAELVLREGLERVPSDGWEAFRNLDLTAPEIGALWLLNAEGRLVATSLSQEPPTGVFSDRAYFTALRDGAEEHLSAMTFGRVSNQWFFAWNRAIRQDGRFTGMTQASIHSEQFSRVAAGLALGPDAVLRLMRNDGAPLMRWPAPAALAPPGNEPPPARSGMREETGPDGIRRLVAWRPAPSMPVIGVAAISRRHVLAPFHYRLVRNAGLFGFSLLLAGALAAAALRAGRREAAARRAAEERGTALSLALAEREGLLASVQEGEARLRLAERAGGIGLWDWDLRDGRLTLLGDVFRRWGLSPRLAAGPRGFQRLPVRAALRQVHPEDRPVLDAALETALRDGSALELEFRLAAGEERWIGIRAETRPGADGRPRRLLGVAHDVTARRREALALAEANAMLERRVLERTGELADANARLRESEARFRGIFNATFSFIGLLSPDGTVLEANDAMLRMGNVETADVIGVAYWDGPWWPDDGAVRALVRDGVQVAAAGQFFRRETTMRDATGRLLSVDFSIQPVRDEDGLVSLLVPEARDISELKAAQALLLEAQKMDTLGQLTGGVAHDFNNLLMAVLGNLGLARRRLAEAPGDVPRHLDAATQAAERGATLTQRLLAFARRQDLRPQAVDPGALLSGVTELLRRSVGPTVQLSVTAEMVLPPVHVDPHALELALMNLAVNARDAMPGGGQLSVEAAMAVDGAPAGLPPGRYVTIAVTDTGHGMDEATLKRAVEPFFTTKGPGHGTGLGLSMVHGLAAQSGGALLIRSVQGEGTCCTLWLPVSAEQVARPGAAPQATLFRGSATVLVVDDEPLVLDSTAEMAAELGYRVLRAGSGDAALAMLGAHPEVAVVVTDVAMPGMTGTVLAERIAESWPALPVILATGHTGRAAEEGGGLRLAKPFGLAQLSGALAAALQGNARE